MTASESQKQLVRRLFEEVLNGSDLEIVDELVHTDFFDHEAPASRANGPDGFRATVRELHEAFAGFRVEPKDLIAEGDRVVVRATTSGRHVGQLNGLPATGSEWAAQAIHIFRVANGQVIEHWASHDGLAAFRQLREPLGPPDRTANEGRRD